MSFLDARSFENTDVLIDMLGTFWSNWFPDQQALANLMSSLGEAYYENHLATETAYRSSGLQDIPVESLRNFGLMHISDALRESSDALKNRYTGQIDYGDGVYYGDLEVFNNVAAYPMPEGMNDVALIYSDVTDPSVVLIRDSDFYVDRSRRVIVFKQDPLTDPRMFIRVVLDEDGVPAGRETSLWGRDVVVDDKLVHTHYGYVLGVDMPSSEHYKTFVGALWAALVQGPSRIALRTAIAALTGIPLAQGDEIVTKILTDTGSVTVITSKTVYVFKPTAAPVVSVGDTLSLGDSIVDSVRVLEPSADTDWSWSPGLSVGRRFTSAPVAGPLFFENSEVTVDHMGTDPEGRAVAQFRVKGWPQDVEAFWRSVHEQGILSGRTLAQLLDTRVNQVGQPDEDDLPATVNPFMFIMDNLLGNNAYVVFLRLADFADGAPGLSAFTHLTKYMAPHTGFVIFVETPAINDYYDTSTISDEGAGFMGGTTMQDTVVVDALVDRGPVIRVVSGSCR